MEYEIVTKNDFKVSGLQTELTRSQDNNYRIIREHWQRFNYELRIRNIQLGKNWEKYGVTKKEDDRYFYFSAIPANKQVPDFKTSNLTGGKFMRFQHNGRIELIKSTVYNIYKRIIPISGLKVDLMRSFLHFEHYDSRFHWSRADSVIDIYIPIES